MNFNKHILLDSPVYNIPTIVICGDSSLPGTCPLSTFFWAVRMKKHFLSLQLLKNNQPRDFPGGPWLRIHLAIQGMQIQS